MTQVDAIYQNGVFTDSAHADRLIAEVALKGQRLIVLDLAFVEVTNAIWKRFYRSLATQDKPANSWMIW